MIQNDVIRRVEWTLLIVQQPTRDRSPAGVLLLDPISDELHVRLLPELKEANREVGEFWRELPIYLSKRSREIGGSRILEWLETSASHVVQVGARLHMTTADPEEALNMLYRTHVAGDLKGQPESET
jgi:hypothetical protein